MSEKKTCKKAGRNKGRYSTVDYNRNREARAARHAREMDRRQHEAERRAARDAKADGFIPVVTVAAPKPAPAMPSTGTSAFRSQLRHAVNDLHARQRAEWEAQRQAWNGYCDRAQALRDAWHATCKLLDREDLWDAGIASVHTYAVDAEQSAEALRTIKYGTVSVAGYKAMVTAMCGEMIGAIPGAVQRAEYQATTPRRTKAELAEVWGDPAKWSNEQLHEYGNAY